MTDPVVAATPPVRVIVVNSVLMGGGVDTHTLSLCEALVHQGAEVQLMIRRGARWVQRAREIAGLRVFLMRAGRLAWPFALAWRIRTTEAHIVHAHHGRDYWVCQLAALLSGTRAKVVATRHLMTPLKEKTCRRLARSTALIAVSDAVESALRASPGGDALHIHRIHCGIDTRFFSRDEARRLEVRESLGFAADDFVFAVIGPVFLPEGKGQFVFLLAAQGVRAAYPNARFLCVGYGDGVAGLMQLATELGLSDRFHFMPFSDDVRGLLQAIDVLVHPAVSSEALGLVILEALSCDKWVIASSLDGIKETFVDGQHGRLVPPRCIGSLQRAMSDAIQSPSATAVLATQRRDWVARHFSLESLGQATLAFYRQLMAVGSRTGR